MKLSLAGALAGADRCWISTNSLLSPSVSSPSGSSRGVTSSASRASCLASTTLMPISLNFARMLSICSELTSSEASNALIWSWVTYPRFFAVRISSFTAVSEGSSTGLSGGVSETLFSGIFSFCGVILIVLAMNSTIDAEPTHDTRQMSLIEGIA